MINAANNQVVTTITGVGVNPVGMTATPDNNYVYDAEGHPRDARQEGFIGTERTVSPGYFATLGMPLTSGRLLTEQDNSGTSRAAVINEEMAERLWPHQNPLGKHINSVKNEQIPGVWDPNQASALVVVGVVGNAREGSLAAGFGDEVYLPMDRANEQPVMYALLRTQAGTAQAAEDMRRSVAEIRPGYSRS